MEELSLFDFPQVEINKPIRLIELFGGIGSQAMALRDIGANFEHYRLVEFDKYAVASYNAIHGTNFTTTDIRDVHGLDMGIVNRQEFTYLLTYSFPCTDLSVAGKMKGMSKEDWKNGNSTRSGLLWEVERILKELKDDELPQVLLMENVPQVHSEQNIADFESWLNFLRSRGYYNFYQDLNAKDYGIPQNRVRCFCVSILSDEFIEFNFPKPIKLETVMKDYLEEEVDEKYYINNEKSEKLIKQLVESGVLSDRQKSTRLTCVSRAQEKLKLQTVSRQDMTQESQTYRQTEAECLSNKQQATSNKQQATSNKQRVPNCKNRVNDKISDRVPGDRLCSDSTCERLQGTGEFRKDERRSNTTECKMLGMLGAEGFEKVRRVYATNALTPTISTKEDRIKILID